MLMWNAHVDICGTRGMQVRVLRPPDEAASPFGCLAVSAGGAHVAASTANGGAITVYELAPPQQGAARVALLKARDASARSNSALSGRQPVGARDAGGFYLGTDRSGALCDDAHVHVHDFMRRTAHDIVSAALSRVDVAERAADGGPSRPQRDGEEEDAEDAAAADGDAS